MTFQEITRPYLDQFGEPHQTFNLPLGDDFFKQWYWYDIDVVAEFVAPKSNTRDGWELSFAISLAPLRYYKKE